MFCRDLFVIILKLICYNLKIFSLQYRKIYNVLAGKSFNTEIRVASKFSSSGRVLVHVHKVDHDHAVVIEIVVVIVVVPVVVVVIIVVGSVDDVNHDLGRQYDAGHHSEHTEVSSTAFRATESVSSPSFKIIHVVKSDKG